MYRCIDIARFVAALFTTSTLVRLFVCMHIGMSIGKEGPFVHLASMIARNLAVHIKPFQVLWKVLYDGTLET